MSLTLAEQAEVEAECVPLLESSNLVDPKALKASFEKHCQFLRKSLALNSPMPEGFVSLEASHPWVVFWAVNGLCVLGQDISDIRERVVSTILSYQNLDVGGFGGGVGQEPHLAGTYASIMTLALCGTPQDWNKINRRKLASFLKEMKQPDGSFRVNQHGECDPRGSYCALVVASILSLDEFEPSITVNTASYLQKCQTYEGGFANCPLGEAHGGYAFCSLAGLCLSGNNPRDQVRNYVHLSSLLKWLSLRQDNAVPGFSGRTNKLVDACYSHWVGGCWPVIEQILPSQFQWASREGLQEYLLKCCQQGNIGGFKDKPSKRPDSYHTNYSLCGLAEVRYKYSMGSNVYEWEAEPLPLNYPSIELTPINPIFGVPLGVAEKLHSHFFRGFPESPPSKEYGGFALYLGASFALVIYLLWALLPKYWLENVFHIEYYPSRWWAMAIPAFVLMLMVYIYVALAAYNTETLTYPKTSLETVTDEDSKIAPISNLFEPSNGVLDLPLALVSEALYGESHDTTEDIEQS